MAYAFEGVDIAKPGGYSLLHFKEVFSRWDSAFAKSGWLSVFLASHDQARLVSRLLKQGGSYFRKCSLLLLKRFMHWVRITCSL